MQCLPGGLLFDLVSSLCGSPFVALRLELFQKMPGVNTPQFCFNRLVLAVLLRCELRIGRPVKRLSPREGDPIRKHENPVAKHEDSGFAQKVWIFAPKACNVHR